MVWLAGLLGFLEFLEFVTAPLGSAVSVWLSLYFFCIQILKLDLWVSTLLPGIVAIDLYLFLKQQED